MSVRHSAAFMGVRHSAAIPVPISMGVRQFRHSPPFRCQFRWVSANFAILPPFFDYSDPRDAWVSAILSTILRLFRPPRCVGVRHFVHSGRLDHILAEVEADIAAGRTTPLNEVFDDS